MLRETRNFFAALTLKYKLKRSAQLTVEQPMLTLRSS
jgi:hypothetical protein